ncbi:hypothetical protein [Ornithinimicrobium cerasi]|uniref:Acetone carboxylase n=1 Tax=Ornithinimicrobium cerasi TaxID=2248773 RepID=A0A285VK94_9MICO|nr:hypothetical protein [Ornithinimicrobium cerasi]SOC54489.1 hypothetical protein SAMN05421879_103173 [Ornithinimicrobium cerasi]
MRTVPPTDRLVCSAKGCRRVASHAVIWRNPRLHAADRRKVWLACTDHRDDLASFVQLRGFLLEVVEVDRLTSADG